MAATVEPRPKFAGQAEISAVTNERFSATVRPRARVLEHARGAPAGLRPRSGDDVHAPGRDRRRRTNRPGCGAAPPGGLTPGARAGRHAQVVRARVAARVDAGPPLP